jgi:hypothetical protein
MAKQTSDFPSATTQPAQEVRRLAAAMIRIAEYTDDATKAECVVQIDFAIAEIDVTTAETSDFPQTDVQPVQEVRRLAQAANRRAEYADATAKAECVAQLEFASAEIVPAPAVPVTATGTPTVALALDNNTVTGVTITEGGATYVAPPVVTFKVGSFTTAIGTAVLTGDAVTSVTITTPGQYSDLDLPVTVTFAAP